VCREFLPEKLVWSILTQLVLALHYCHTGGADPPYLEGSLSATTEGSSTGSTKTLSHIVLHRDIKPENSTPIRPLFTRLLTLGQSS
jgi:NIMA (never in mitosis gene a)-related kinase 2